LKNTLRPKHKERNHSTSHSIPAFIGRNWVGLLKIPRPNTKKGITKEQHINPAFIGRIGRTVEKYFKTKHKERNHKRAAHHSTSAL
jgi:hypothetical protein